MNKKNTLVVLSSLVLIFSTTLYTQRRTISSQKKMLTLATEYSEIQDEFLHQIAHQIDYPVRITPELATRMKFYTIMTDNDLS